MTKDQNTISDLAKRLKKIRLCLNMTQEEFAALLNLDQGKVSKYETETLKIPIEITSPLISIGLNIDWFFTGQGDMFSPASPFHLSKKKLTPKNQEILISLIENIDDTLVEQIKELNLEQIGKLTTTYNENKLFCDSFLSILQMKNKEKVMEGIEYLRALFEAKFSNAS